MNKKKGVTMFKKYLTVAVMAGLLLSLSGISFCRTRITVLAPSAWYPPRVVKPVEEAFEKEHPNIDLVVELVPVTKYHDMVLMRGVAKDLPDCFMTVSDYRFEVYRKSGLLTSLDELAQDAGVDWSKYPQIVFRQCIRDGKLWGFPRPPIVRGTINYNKDIFRELGLEFITADTTWEEFKEISRKLVKKDSNGKVLRFACLSKYPMLDIAYLFGGRIVDDPFKPKRILFAQTEFVEGMREFLGMVEEGTMMSSTLFKTLGGNKPKLFCGEKVATIITVMNWKGQFATAPFDWDIELIPAPNGKFGGTHGSHFVWLVSSSSENSKEAFEWIRWLVLSPTALRTYESQWDTNRDPQIPYDAELQKIYAEIADKRKPKNWRCVLEAQKHFVPFPSFKDAEDFNQIFWTTMWDIVYDKAPVESLIKRAKEAQMILDELNK